MSNKEGQNPIEEKLPFGKNMVFALQHVFVMVAGAVAVPLMVGGNVGLDTNGIRYLISCALFAAGVATIIQTMGIKNFMGAKIPVVEGTSFASATSMTAIAAAALAAGNGEAGLREIAGSVLVAGLFCFLMSGIWGKMLHFFPKVVTGTVVTVIGISLFPVGIRWITDGKPQADLSNMFLAAMTLVLLLLFHRFFKGILGNLSVLLGIVAGTALAIAMGKMDFTAIAEAPWFGVVTPMTYGTPIFNPASILSFLMVMLVIMTEATGNMIAVSNVAGRQIDEKTLSKGLRASGFSTMFSALFNSYPVTPFAQNVGILGMTGVYSRFVTATAGVILAILGFFPKFAAVFSSIPKPVLGGAGFAMFGMVAVGGIRTLGKVNYNGNKNAMIVAISIGLSLIPTVVPDFFGLLPENANRILHSGITIGCVSAILLNIFFNILFVPKEQRQREDSD